MADDFLKKYGKSSGGFLDTYARNSLKNEWAYEDKLKAEAEAEEKIKQNVLNQQAQTKAQAETDALNKYKEQQDAKPWYKKIKFGGSDFIGKAIEGIGAIPRGIVAAENTVYKANPLSKPIENIMAKIGFIDPSDIKRDANNENQLMKNSRQVTNELADSASKKGAEFNTIAPNEGKISKFEKEAVGSLGTFLPATVSSIVAPESSIGTLATGLGITGTASNEADKLKIKNSDLYGLKSGGIQTLLIPAIGTNIESVGGNLLKSGTGKNMLNAVLKTSGKSAVDMAGLETANLLTDKAFKDENGNSIGPKTVGEAGSQILSSAATGALMGAAMGLPKYAKVLKGLKKSVDVNGNIIYKDADGQTIDKKLVDAAAQEKGFNINNIPDETTSETQGITSEKANPTIEDYVDELYTKTGKNSDNSKSIIEKAYKSGAINEEDYNKSLIKLNDLSSVKTSLNPVKNQAELNQSINDVKNKIANFKPQNDEEANALNETKNMIDKISSVKTSEGIEQAINNYNSVKDDIDNFLDRKNTVDIDNHSQRDIPQEEVKPVETEMIENQTAPTINEEQPVNNTEKPETKQTVFKEEIKPADTSSDTIDSIWKNKDVDQPVKITNYAGNMNGVDYVNIEGSRSAIPIDELSNSEEVLNKFKNNTVDNNIQNTAENIQKVEDKIDNSSVETKKAENNAENNTEKAKSKLENPFSKISDNEAKKEIKNNPYLSNKDINYTVEENVNKTAKNIRESIVEKKNQQYVIGRHVSDKVRKLAPEEQVGIQLNLDAGGDKNYLQSMVDNESTKLDKIIPNSETKTNPKGITYRQGYKQALNLSENGKQAAQMLKDGYKALGQYSYKNKTIHDTRKNFANRIYQQDDTAPTYKEIKDKGISTFTKHSQEREFDTIGDAILADKTPASLNAGDLYAVYNNEVAKANSAVELKKSLSDSKLFQTFDKKEIPKGFKTIPGYDKQVVKGGKVVTEVFAGPEKLVNGLKAITEPDITNKIEKLRLIKKYQGVVKTIDLSLSVYHHFALTAQALYNTHGGIDILRNIKNLRSVNSDDFNKMEENWAGSGLMTTSIDYNEDINRSLTKKGSVADKITNAPVLKQVKGAMNANNDFLFDKLQRWLKVNDAQIKLLDYVAKHPETDNIKLESVKRNIAEEVNLAYGGLNWEALGRTKSQLSGERLALLAPDWTESSIRMFGKATGLDQIDRTKGFAENLKNVIKGDYSTKLARTQYAVGIGGAYVATQWLNTFFTGHGTSKNPAGHEFEVQVAPNVYISLFKSGIGDFTKYISDVANNGVLGGTSKFFQGKSSPFLKAGISIATQRNSYGQAITSSKNTYMQNAINELKNIGDQLIPAPFGVNSAAKYITKSDNPTWSGAALVGSGAARYSGSNANPNNPVSSYSNNIFYKLLNPKNQKKMNDLKAFEKEENGANSDISQSIEKDLNDGLDKYQIANKYNLTVKDAVSKIKSAQKNLDEYSQSQLQQEFDKLSKDKQQKYIDSLSDEEKEDFLKYVTLK